MPQFKSKFVEDVPKFMKTARERFDFGSKSDEKDRLAAVEDTNFVAGGSQWEQSAMERRRKYNRPVLEWNRLHIYVAQVANAGAQNDRSIKISPGDGGTKETAEYFQGRIRQIEYECNSSSIQNKARQQQITCGRGFYRIKTEYKYGTWQQIIKLEPIPNQFSVVLEPGFINYDASDCNWGFVTSTYSREEFKNKFGEDAEVVKCDFFKDQDNPAPNWVGVGESAENVQVADYYERTYTKRPLAILRDGTWKWSDEVEKRDQIQAEREEKVPKVCLYTIDGVEIHAEAELLVDCLPIVSYWGTDEIVDGEKRTRGLVRFAKGPQRLVNFYVSNIAEQVGSIPKSPYVAAEGQIDGYEDIWADANVDPKAVLPYVPVSIDGHLVPAPQRIVSEPPIQAMTIGLNQAIDGIKAAMGIFDASLGAKSNETSGIAIQKRTREADNANAHFSINEDMSRKHAGRMLLQLIRKIETKGEYMIRMPDETSKKVKVGKPFQDEKTGQMIHHKIEEGEYEPLVSSGPSYSSMREEAFGVYSQIAQADPTFMARAGDILFKNLDAPGSDAVAERYEKSLPPELQDPKPGEQQLPPQVQQALQQSQKMIQALSAQLHKAEDDAAAKRPEIDAKIRIAEMENDREIKIAEMSETTKRMQIEATRAATQVTEGLKAEAVHLREHMQTLRDMQAAEQQAQQQIREELAATPEAQPDNPNAVSEMPPPPEQAQPAPEGAQA